MVDGYDEEGIMRWIDGGPGDNDGDDDATSSVVLWLRILRMVHPVSSILTRRPRESQQAHEP